MENAYKKLVVYQKAKALVMQVYTLLRNFPTEEKFALCDQLRRAIVSVPSNIAEGLSRYSEKEKIHFLEIAFGSLMEVECQLEIAKDLLYITEEEYVKIDEAIADEAKILAGMRSNLVSHFHSPSH